MERLLIGSKLLKTNSNLVAGGFGTLSDSVIRSGRNLKWTDQNLPESLGFKHIAYNNQCHGSRVERADFDYEPVAADGLCTNRSGLALMIFTADCVPILALDPYSKVIGGAHAGWRGILSNILESLVQAMTTLGAERNQIRMVMGPHIGACNYQIDDQFRKRFVEQNPANKTFFTPWTKVSNQISGCSQTSKSHPGDHNNNQSVWRAETNSKQNYYACDLAGMLALQAARAGIKEFEKLEHDTFAEEELFVSYRRLKRSDQPDPRSLVSVIGLT